MHCSTKINNLVRVVPGWSLKKIPANYGYSVILPPKTNSHSLLNNRTFYATQNKNDLSDAKIKSKRMKLSQVPNFKDFLASESMDIQTPIEEISPPYLEKAKYLSPPNGRTVYFETYGCQMNVNDAEYAWAILKNVGYKKVDTFEKVNQISIY